MYNYKNIKQMHLEPSSLCNAECPVCNRRLNGGPKNPVMTERCITLDEFKEWFPVDFLKQLEQLTLCGNYGDPMTSPYLIEIISYFREINSTASISMNTNASGRDKKFWEDLSEIMGERGRVVFSVDGLEDTNHLYRKGTNWEKIMNAMTSFIGTGKSSVPWIGKATATWEFLVFEHNQHQVAEARKLSEEIGFDEFYAKKAMGFNNVTSETVRDYIDVLDNDGRLDYKIYAPDNEWKNESMFKKPIQKSKRNIDKTIILQDVNINYDYSQNNKITSVDTNTLNKLDGCEINCIALYNEERRVWKMNPEGYHGIFVSSTGLVFPCCFVASKYHGSSSFETLQFREFVESYGEDTINLNKMGAIKNVIDSDIMKHGYVDRWNKPSIASGKLFTCSTFCGKGVNEEVRSTKKSISGKA